MKTRIQTKRANKHNRPSCLISTSISVHSMLFSNYQNCGYVVYKFVNCVVCFVASLLQVCCKFIAKFVAKFVAKFEYSNSNKRPTQQKPYHTRFGFIGWLIDRIYNKQQYNDQSVNCCKQPTPTSTPNPNKTPYYFISLSLSLSYYSI
jgi:hypothetical protein